MKKVDGPVVRLVDETDERFAELLPEDLAIELGQVAALCREGLMASSVEAGLAAAQAIMAEEADASCGAWNARDTDRTHRLGGQRLPIRRRRVHAVDDKGDPTAYVALATFGVFANSDLLNRTVMNGCWMGSRPVRSSVSPIRSAPKQGRRLRRRRSRRCRAGSCRAPRRPSTSS